MAKILAQGAEALITLKDNIVKKERISKNYRHKDIDNKLRKFRTRREAKVLKKLEILNFPSPRLLSSNDKTMVIDMEFIKGKLLKDAINKNPIKLSKELGEKIAILHENDIIHGDLTTSNMILNDVDNQIYFIDFGLSFFSIKFEDKAVDLHLLNRALESKHHDIYKKCIKAALEAYSKTYSNANEVLARLEKVESRGRYKKKKKRNKNNKK